MPETTKLVSYLNDAYATERRLETALQAHIALTPHREYKARLREHLKETKAHARAVAKRIKQLGGETEALPVPAPEAVAKGAAKAKAAAQKAVAAAQGPLHAVRGESAEERMLKNARTELQDEGEELAHYRTIEALAKAAGDKETAKLAREIAREEKKMSDYLTGLLGELATAVVVADAPDEAPAAAPRPRSTRRTAAKPRAKAAPKTRAKARTKRS